MRKAEQEIPSEGTRQHPHPARAEPELAASTSARHHLHPMGRSLLVLFHHQVDQIMIMQAVNKQSLHYL